MAEKVLCLTTNMQKIERFRSVKDSQSHEREVYFLTETRSHTAPQFIQKLTKTYEKSTNQGNLKFRGD